MANSTYNDLHTGAKVSQTFTQVLNYCGRQSFHTKMYPFNGTDYEFLHIRMPITATDNIYVPANENYKV